MRVVAATLGLLALLAAPRARAWPSICVRDLAAKLERPFRIDVGCERIDCCVGCPGGPISLRIRIAGSSLAGGELRLAGEGMPERTLPLELGETHVADAGEAFHEGVPPVATLRLRPAPRFGKGEDAPASFERETIEVRVEQLLDGHVVSAFARKWDVLACRPTGGCDEIRQTGNQGGDDSVIQIDGRRSSGCVDDELRRSGGTASVGNLLSASACRSEVAVYSSGNAMEMHESVLWTDACGDRHDVALRPAWKVPVTFYLGVPDTKAISQWGQTVKAVAEEDLKNANQIYDDNKTGISFAADPANPAEFRTLKDGDFAKLAVALPLTLPAVLLSGLPSGFQCSVTNALERAGLYGTDRLNVYYLELPGTGMICPDDRNVVFLALGKKPATLAHEFGHSLSLLGDWGHTNGVLGFRASNVMWGGDEVRNHISLGQAFRQNLEPVSTINTNQVRSGPTRSCPLREDSERCPRLDEDWTRP